MFRKYLKRLFFIILIFNAIFLISKYSNFVSNYKPKFFYHFFGLNLTNATSSHMDNFILNISTFIIRKDDQNCVFEISNETNSKHVIDKNVMPFQDIESKLKNLSIQLESGGLSLSNTNHKCKAKQNIAFIIPYRNRTLNLKSFLNNMHPFLTRQLINYKIYIVEPTQSMEFNRGLLSNIGFLEAIKDEKNISSNFTWDCFIFHDVDMIPEDLRLVYECNDKLPVHLAVAVSKFGYR